jgi:HSP20 family molecular chaperone IbpA
MNTLARPADTTAATPAAGTRPTASLQPPVDVFEDASGISLYADLPGVPRDKLQLRVEGDQLTLEGEIELAVTHGMESTHAEVTLPRYRRAFTLSKELDANQVSAELSQGVLRVRIPKAAHLQPRRIEVKVA